MTLKTSFLKRSRNDELMNTVAERIQSDPETITRALEVLAELHNPREKINKPENGITISDASRKYKIPNSTISGWIKNGFIPVVKETGKQKYIDNNVIKCIAEQYKKGQGRGNRQILQILKDK